MLAEAVKKPAGIPSGVIASVADEDTYGG